MVSALAPALAMVLATAGLMIMPAAATAAAGPKLAVTSLGFADSSVDASSGDASVTVDWTITDSDAKATDVSGTLDIRMAGSTPGTYTGLTYVASYDLTGFSDASGSGTAQDASFSWTFAVPQYAGTGTAQWVVTRVVAQDDQGHKIAPSGAQLAAFHPVLTATEAIDSTAPTYDSLMFGDPDQRPYLYDNGVSATISYYFEPDDSQSGLWRGTIRISGPGGRTIATPFSLTFSQTQQNYFCGSALGGGPTSMLCDIQVTIPAGTAPGTWKVSSLSLTDNAGNVTTYRGINALPVTVTADQTLTASDFSFSPNPVDNWTGNGTTELSMRVAGATGGITGVYVDAANYACNQSSTTPMVNADGTISVPMYMLFPSAKCTISGIAVVDGAGDVSVYGSAYHAPDPGLTLAQVPDTTPPVVTSASLSSPSVSYSPDSQFLGLTLNVDDQVAPIDDCTITIHDASGDPAGGTLGACNYSKVVSGSFEADIDIPAGLPPGTYSVAFMVTDAGNLTSQYGYSSSAPVPGGPLQFTVTGSATGS